MDREEYTHPRCWAGHTRECSRQISREHIVSSSAFESELLTVSGLPFLDGETKEIPTERMATKALCTAHNTALSPLDDAVGDFCNVLREVERLRQERVKIPRVRKTHRFVLDGPAVERAVLKIALNLHRVLRKDTFPEWEMPSHVADTVLGRRDLPDGAGLATLTPVGVTLQNEDAGLVGFEPCEEPRYIVFRLRGHFTFVCTWDTPVTHLEDLVFEEETLGRGTAALFHLKRINVMQGKRDLRLSLDFDWSGEWNERAHRNVTGLRGRFPTARLTARKRKR